MLAFVGKLDEQLVRVIAYENVRRFAFSSRILLAILFLRKYVDYIDTTQQATDWIALWEVKIFLPIMSQIESL